MVGPDLLVKLGGIPAERIRLNPPPGTATEADLHRRLHGLDQWICELIDGVLVDKDLSTRMGVPAASILHRLGNYVHEQDCGVLLGGKMPFRLRPGRVRVPNVSFLAWERFPDEEVPDEEITDIVPDLALDILGPGNTAGEFDIKLDDYFSAGVRLVWLIDPARERATILSGRDRRTEIGTEDTLNGGDVLPGFSLPLAEVLDSPKRKKRKPR